MYNKARQSPCCGDYPGKLLAPYDGVNSKMFYCIRFEWGKNGLGYISSQRDLVLYLNHPPLVIKHQIYVTKGRIVLDTCSVLFLLDRIILIKDVKCMFRGNISLFRNIIVIFLDLPVFVLYILLVSPTHVV